MSRTKKGTAKIHEMRAKKAEEYAVFEINAGVAITLSNAIRAYIKLEGKGTYLNLIVAEEILPKLKLNAAQREEIKLTNIPIANGQFATRWDDVKGEELILSVPVTKEENKFLESIFKYFNDSGTIPNTNLLPLYRKVMSVNEYSQGKIVGDFDLTFKERVALKSILMSFIQKPHNATYGNLSRVVAIIDYINFSEEEVDQAQLFFSDNEAIWDENNEPDINITTSLDSDECELLERALKSLDKSGELTLESLSLYKKFVDED